MNSVLRAEDSFDFKHPDYDPIFRERRKRLLFLQQNPQALADCKVWYKSQSPAVFINDWGCTIDPRNAALGLPVIVPFILWPRQVDWVDYAVRKWRTSEPGLSEKSRDCGLTWLAVGTSCTLCLFNDGIAVGFGSRKQEYVDVLGDPKAILPKARFFLSTLPVEFTGTWDVTKHAPHMRIFFPDTGSIIAGEAGDDIGRGDRKSIYFVDEAAHLERPKLVDASLAATTNCRHDISSVNGMANSFAERRHSGKVEVFTFHWRDDPRKDDAWYAKKCAELDAVTIAQEYDISYSASVEGIVIPAVWVNAAVDAHVKLKLPASGVKAAALDVADRGADKNALAVRHGNVLTFVQSWSGKATGDIFVTTEKAFALSDINGVSRLRYDADGVGASVRGDANQINKERKRLNTTALRISAFLGSGKVLEPEKEMITGRKNKDFFENFKAQAWWQLRERFRATYRAVQGLPFDPDDIISIASDCPERARLCVELSQPVYGQSKAGKMLITKTPEGSMSPNLADACMMLFAPAQAALHFSDEAIEDMGDAVKVG